MKQSKDEILSSLVDLPGKTLPVWVRVALTSLVVSSSIAGLWVLYRVYLTVGGGG